MNWSPETSALRDRYMVLYGVTQGMGICVAVMGLGCGFGLTMPGCLLLGWGLSLIAGGVMWRWSWRAYRRAYRAELDERVERARLAFDEALSRPSAVDPTRQN